MGFANSSRVVSVLSSEIPIRDRSGWTQTERNWAQAQVRDKTQNGAQKIATPAKFAKKPGLKQPGLETPNPWRRNCKKTLQIESANWKLACDLRKEVEGVTDRRAMPPRTSQMFSAAFRLRSRCQESERSSKNHLQLSQITKGHPNRWVSKSQVLGTVKTRYFGAPAILVQVWVVLWHPKKASKPIFLK